MQALDEPVHIVEYDGAWPVLFSSERARIVAILNVPTERVEHIGSTAVEGLVAKPIVDIMLGTDDWPPAGAVGEMLTRNGYESLGEADVPERLYFRLRGPSSFNLHVVRFGGPHWRSNIVLREYLREHESARVRYARAKRAVISAGAVRLLAYSEAKSATVAALLEEALTHQDVG